MPKKSRGARRAEWGAILMSMEPVRVRATDADAFARERARTGLHLPHFKVVILVILVTIVTMIIVIISILVILVIL